LKFLAHDFRRDGDDQQRRLGHAMNSNRYRSQLAAATDDQLRYEFLKLLAQEGRQHFIRQIDEQNISDPSGTKTAPLLSQQGGS
jgi:hypothetical protein